MEKKNIQPQHILMYAGTLFLVILSVLAIVTAVFISKGTQQYEEHTISVQGTAELTAAPDIASFSFEIKETADSVEQAQKVISQKIDTILDGLDELDISEKDITTESYAMYPKYEWVQVDRRTENIAPDGTVYYPGNNQKRVQTGFDVSQRVRIKVRDFEKVSSALTLLAKAKVDNLNGPNFEIDTPEELEAEAREKAINDAREKARRLANDLGVSLGKVISFNENKGGYYPEPYYAKGMVAMDSANEQAPSPQLPAGENTINSQVTITYAIK